MIYHINENDEIVFVDDEWNRFARDNDGQGVVAETVLNRPLWEFVTDRTTRQLYEEIIARARLGRKIEFTFRCDAPAMRRQLAMRVQRRADTTVEFRTIALQEEPRTALEPPAATGEDEGKPLVCCSWCKRYLVANEWLELEDAIEPLGIFDSRTDQTTQWRITHGMCGECYDRIDALLEANGA